MSIRQGRRQRIVGLTLGALVVAGCGGPSPETLVSSSLDLVPTAVDYVIVIDDLSQVHAGLDVAGMAAQHPDLIGQLGRGLRSQFGFDPVDLAGLRESGVDPDQPTAIAILSDPPGATVMVLAGDGPRMAERVDEVHRRQGALPTEAGRYRGIPITDASRTATTWVTLSGYLVTVSGVGRNDERVALARSILENAGPRALASDTGFRGLADALSAPPHILLFQAPVPPGGHLPGIVPGTHRLPFLVGGAEGAHDGLVVGLRVAPDSLIVDGRCRVTGSPLATMAAAGVTRGVDFLSRVPGDPFAQVATHLDPAAAWARFGSDSAGSPGFLSGLSRWARRRLGIDLETDVVAHLGSHLGIIVNEFAIQGTDAVIHAELENPLAFAATLDRVAERLRVEPIQAPLLGRIDVQRDRIGEREFYQLPFGPLGQVCFGIVDGHAIITANRARYAAVVGGAGGSVLESLPDDRARADLEADPMVFVTVEPRTAIARLSALSFIRLDMVDRFLTYLRPFDTAVMSADATEGMVVGRMRAWSNEPGVWIRILNDVVRAWRPDRGEE